MRSRFHRRSPDFAGLWHRWIDPATKEEILSCTVIVSGASEWMSPYDRMPVLLRAEDFDAWLNGSLGTEALRPAAESALREWPVSRRVNAPASAKTIRRSSRRWRRLRCSGLQSSALCSIL
jgi:putative SOS response-associated peptidase YedK